MDRMNHLAEWLNVRTDVPQDIVDIVRTEVGSGNIDSGQVATVLRNLHLQKYFGPCNTDNLTLPMFALMYCPTSLSIELPYEVIVSRVIIRYDAYTLETSLRKKWFTSDIKIGERMLFSEGTFQKVMH